MRELIIMMAKLVWEGVVVSDARMKTLIFTRGPKQDCCPECGGTELFDGHGTCQICQPM